MRTYSEREVSAIIERAVQRQQDADAGAPDAGLTLAEIERLGRESGIDPAHLRAAASEIDTEGRTLRKQTGQTRTEIIVERWIDNRLTVSAWEDIVDRLREEHGMLAGAMMTGTTTGDTIRQIGESYEWSNTSSLGVVTRVVVSPRDGRTRLRMTQLVGVASPTAEGIGYGVVIAMVLAIVAAMMAKELTDGVMSPGLTGLTTFLLAWIAASPAVAVLDRRWRAKKLRQLDALADDLVPLVRDAAPDAAPAIEQAPAPQLDLEALADPEATTGTAERRRVSS